MVTAIRNSAAQRRVVFDKRVPLWRALYLAAFALWVLAVFSPAAYGYDQLNALLIGLGNYEIGRGKGSFRDLSMVPGDLETMAEVLKQIGFQVDIYSDLDPQRYRRLLFPDEDSTQAVRVEHLRTTIEDFVESHKNENSLVLIYFTGHGGLAGKTNRLLAVPDSVLRDELSFADVSYLLETIDLEAPRARKIMVIDACANELTTKVVGFKTRPDDQLPVHVFSSDLTEASFFDKKMGKSIFTHYFAMGLQEADDLGYGDYSGTIDSDEIIDYVKRRVPLHVDPERKNTKMKQVNQVQHPFGSGSPNIMLAESDKPVVDPPVGASDADRAVYFHYLKNIFYGGDK